MKKEILIVDDHAIIRIGLSKIIEFEKDMAVTAHSVSAEEAINLFLRKKFDVVILDISLPGRSGLDIIKDLKKLQPGIRIIILSMYKEEQFAIRAFKAGASGYLTKEMAPEEIVRAIRKVSTGGRYISANFAAQLLDEFIEPSDSAPHEVLSDREYEVMRLIASGKSVSEIASVLSLSDRTVSTYRTRILEKMNLKNNAAIIHYALENKLLD